MIIPVLDLEGDLQLNDLTRFDASKSVLVKGSVGAISSVKIKAGADASEIEVFNSLSKNWYLDFMFNTYKFDVDSTNDELVFEVDGEEYTTNVLTGTYDLANLLSQIKDAMEAIASPLTVNFTLDAKNRIKTAPSSALKIKPTRNSRCLFQHLGYYKDDLLEGNPVEYGLRKITLKVSTTNNALPVENNSISKYMKVYSADGDSLFSADTDLVSEEPDIMKWTKEGRASFLDLHRKAQRLIVDWFDREGYRDDNEEKITKWAFVDNSDVRMWSYYMVLKMFCRGVRNQTDDVWKKKATEYEKDEIAARKRATLNLDLDKDDKPDVNDGPDVQSGRLYFR